MSSTCQEKRQVSHTVGDKQGHRAALSQEGLSVSWPTSGGLGLRNSLTLPRLVHEELTSCGSWAPRGGCRFGVWKL